MNVVPGHRRISNETKDAAEVVGGCTGIPSQQHHPHHPAEGPVLSPLSGPAPPMPPALGSLQGQCLFEGQQEGGSPSLLYPGHRKETCEEKGIFYQPREKNLNLYA